MEALASSLPNDKQNFFDMKVYLLVHNFAFDGTPDTNIEAYATKQLAQDAMVKDYNDLEKEYRKSYDDQMVCYEEPSEDGACIYIDGDYNEKHDDWTIVETKIIQ